MNRSWDDLLQDKLADVTGYCNRPVVLVASELPSSEALMVGYGINRLVLLANYASWGLER